MDKLLNKQLGEVLKSLREKSGLSVRELAKKIKKGHSTVSDHELGKTSISLEVFLEYCKFYDVNPSEILKQINYRHK